MGGAGKDISVMMDKGVVQMWMRLSVKAVMFILAGAVLLPSARAQEITSWSECVQAAKAHNPNLLAAEDQLRQAQADFDIAASGWYPQANVSASASKSTDLESAESTRYSASVSVRQLLFDGLKTPAGVGKAKAQLHKTQSQVAKLSAGIRYDLREAYIGVLKSKETLTLTDIIAKRRRQNVQLVKLRYEAGREHSGSLLTAEADLAQAQYEVQQAQRNHDLSRQKLLTAIGGEAWGLAGMAGEFAITENLAEQPDIPALAENTPAVAESKAAVEMSRWGVQAAYAELYPSLYLSGSAGLEDNHWLPEEKRLSASLNLSLPLFEGGSRLTAINKAKYALSQTRNNLQSTHNETVLGLQNNWKNLLDAAAKVEVDKLYLQAAQARAKIVNAQYSSGLASFDDWAIIEDRLVNAQKSYLNAQTELLSAEAQWLQAKGKGLEDE